MNDFQGNTGMNQTLNMVMQNVTQNLQANATARFGGSVTIANTFNMSMAAGTIQASDRQAERADSEEGDIEATGPKSWLQKFNAVMDSEVFKSIVKIGKQFVKLAEEVDVINRGIAKMTSSSVEAAKLSESMMQAANRSRLSYQDFAGNSTKLSAVAGDKFTSSQELVDFNEVFSKSMKISNTQDQAGAFKQMSTGMAKGSFSGLELSNLSANIPMVMEVLTNQLGKSREELIALADQGLISSEIIKGAFLNSTSEINEQFSATPLTFAEGFTMIKNVLLGELMPVIDQFNELMASDTAQEFFALLLPVAVLFGMVLAGIVSIVLFLVEMFLTGVSFIVELIVSLAGFIGQIINFVLMMIVTGLALLLPFLLALAAIWIAINLAIMVSAISSALAVAAAWLLANWPLLLLIGILALVVAAMIKMGVTVSDVIGFVAGVFGALYAYLYNLFATFWNLISSVVEFFANVWSNPLYSIKKLFASIWNGIIGIVASAIDGIISLINLIPGVDISASGLVEKIGIDVGEAPDNYWKAPKMGLKNIGETAGAWSNNTSGFIDGVGDSVSGFFDGKFDNLLDKFQGNGGKDSTNTDLANLLNQNNGQDLGSIGDTGSLGLGGGAMPNYDAGSGLGSVPNYSGAGTTMPSLDDKLGKGKEIGNIGKINEDVSITEEDIKLMRDLAERDFILNYQQLTPSATVNFSSTGNTEQDAKKLLEMMEAMVVDASAAQLI